jgi:hypothetical protein
VENVVDAVNKYGNRVKTEELRRVDSVEHVMGLDSGTIVRGLTITYFICVCITKFPAVDTI